MQTLSTAAHAETFEERTDVAFTSETAPVADAPSQDRTETVSSLMLRGRRIAYRQAGGRTPNIETPRAHPAVLAHSSASHSGQWRPLIADMALERRVLAPDLHGYGGSDPAPSAAPIYIHDAAAVAELVEQCHEPAHLIGHGFGGLVAARVARDHPMRVASVTLIEPSAFQILEETEDPRRLELAEAAAAVTTLVSFDEMTAAARLYIDFWNGAGAFDALGPEPQAYVVSSASRIADDLRAANLAAPGQMVLEEFADLQPPVHLISGSRSRPPARAVIARLRNVLPHAHWTDVPEGGHMAAATEPDRINPAIVRFIQAVEGRTPQ